MKLGFRALVFGILCAVPVVSFASCPKPSELVLEKNTSDQNYHVAFRDKTSPNNKIWATNEKLSTLKSSGAIVLVHVQISQPRGGVSFSPTLDGTCTYSISGGGNTTSVLATSMNAPASWRPSESGTGFMLYDCDASGSKTCDFY